MNDDENRLWRELQNDLADARRARDHYERALRLVAPNVAERVAESLKPIPCAPSTVPSVERAIKEAFEFMSKKARPRQ